MVENFGNAFYFELSNILLSIDKAKIPPDLLSFYENNIIPIDLEIMVECPCDGKKFKVNVNKEIEDWKGDGTLDAFFNIV